MQTDSASGIRNHADRYIFPTFVHSFQEFDTSCDAKQVSCLCLQNGAVSFEDLKSPIRFCRQTMSSLPLVMIPKPSRPKLMCTPTRRVCEAMFISILPLLSYWPQFCARCSHPSISLLLVCLGNCKRLRTLTRTTSQVALPAVASIALSTSPREGSQCSCCVAARKGCVRGLLQPK